MSKSHHADASREMGNVAKSRSQKRYTTIGTGPAKTNVTQQSAEIKSSIPERHGPEDRQAMIAEAAYFRAEKHNFSPGHELDDWLAAETEIDAALCGRRVALPEELQ